MNKIDENELLMLCRMILRHLDKGENIKPDSTIHKRLYDIISSIELKDISKDR